MSENGTYTIYSYTVNMMIWFKGFTFDLGVWKYGRDITCAYNV